LGPNSQSRTTPSTAAPETNCGFLELELEAVPAPLGFATLKEKLTLWFVGPEPVPPPIVEPVDGLTAEPVPPPQPAARSIPVTATTLRKREYIKSFLKDVFGIKEYQGEFG